jgi:hypothetical protein
MIARYLTVTPRAKVRPLVEVFIFYLFMVLSLYLYLTDKTSRGTKEEEQESY